MKAKDILGWVKQNLWIVICSVLILIVLPVSIFMSSSWLTSILGKHEKAVSGELAKVQSSTIEYSLPQVDPSMEAFKFKSEPNAKITDFLKKKKDEMTSAVQKVARQGEDFNAGRGDVARALGRKPHEPLIAGLFPKPEMTKEQARNAAASRDIEQAKLNEAEDKFLGNRGNPNPYAKLLESVKAGQPRRPEELAEQLKDLFAKRLQSVAANPQQPTAEESEKLKQEMIEARLGEYQGRARSLGVYASMGCFPGVPVEGDSNSGRVDAGEHAIPYGSISPADLNRSRLFFNQWDLWVLNDTFAAIRLANTDENGALKPLDKAVVKRIERIRLFAPENMLDPSKVVLASPPEDGGGESQEQPEEAPPSATPGMIPLDPKVSITGRTRGGWNELYEVRRVSVQLVVSSAGLPKLLDGIPRVNFMTVTRIDVAPVDVWEDLRIGYYYGDEHVVRVTLDIESLWLKSWIVNLMPDEVKTVLRIPLPAPSEGEGEGESSDEANPNQG